MARGNPLLPKVYVETTIPSFYCDSRTAPAVSLRRAWTREWWKRAQSGFELFTSEAVLEELAEGAPAESRDRLVLVQDLVLLPLEPAIIEIVQVYVQHRLMPRSTTGDALHLALASYHRCDFLVTWNCRHLANANKFGHIRRVNTMLGLYVPALVTPLEMLGDNYDPPE
jgi:predicted nucleic acid-binding protein